MKRVAIIQARTSSSRLPGKVLELIDGVPMIVFMLRRVAFARQLDQVILATSTDTSDDSLADVVSQFGFDLYRGDLADVLGRFVGAAIHSAADVVVRLTGDCPLIDPDIVDECVLTLVKGSFDYVSNVDPPTFPDGLDVEAFTIDALLKTSTEAALQGEREHVTPYIRNNKVLFRQYNIQSNVDLSSLRWTVDHHDDLELVRALVASAHCSDIARADRFDFLRALYRLGSGMPRNQHDRNEGMSPKSALGPTMPPSSIS